MIIVSSCLIGLEVRYDGNHCYTPEVENRLKKSKAVPVCPEVLGGLCTPRDPAEIVGGNGDDVLDGNAKVITVSGKDVTEAFLKGAYETLKKAQQVGATVAILKQSSPSCGSTLIYNGSFSGNKIVGSGVTTALLRRYGIEVLSEDTFKERGDESGSVNDERDGSI